MPGPGKTKAASEGSYVLIVEDDDFDAAVLTSTIKAYGHTIHRASDGAAALQVMARMKPDLVLLDISMPGRSGHDVLQAIRSDPQHELVPVVMCSTSSSKHDVEASYRGRANAYVKKPDTYEGYEALAGRLSDFWFSQALLP